VKRHGIRKEGSEERRDVLQNGGTLSGRQARKLAKEQGSGRMIDGVLYDSGGKKAKIQPGGRGK